jgi:hypothetical protein
MPFVAWRTYTPDGRALEVEFADGTWTAICEGGQAAGPSAAEAIKGALDNGATVLGASRSGLSAWVADQAARLEREQRGHASGG